MHAIPADQLALLHNAMAEALHRHGAARHLQRLLAVVLVGSGQACRDVAVWLGVSARSVERWVRAFDNQGLQQLVEKHSGGRPPALSARLLLQLKGDLEAAPPALGYGQAHWGGKLLALHLARRYGLRLSERHCQRILQRMRSPAPPSGLMRGKTALARRSVAAPGAVGAAHPAAER